MLEPIFQFAEKFITDFSWRRLTIFFSLIGLIALSLILYEWQTATTELTRYERSTTLLEKLDVLVSSSNKETVELSKLLIRNLNDVVKKENLASKLEVSTSPELAQSFFAILPWILFFLLYLPSSIKNDKKDTHNTITGFILIVSIIGLVAYFIPSDWNKWIRYGGIQLINLFLFIFFAYIGQKKNHEKYNTPH